MPLPFLIPALVGVGTFLAVQADDFLEAGQKQVNTTLVLALLGAGIYLYTKKK